MAAGAVSQGNGVAADVTIEGSLREALLDAGGGRVTFPRDLHGFPGIVHGGAVAALFFRATTPRPPVRLSLTLRHGVPTETPLRLVTGSDGARARLAIQRDDQPLAEATLSRESVPAVDPATVVDAWRQDRAPLGRVPGTATCLACGSRNPLGLGIRFQFNDRFLWHEYVPPPTYRAADGHLHPALAMVMLDELGWWLGALRQGECGVTTEVTVDLYRALPLGPVLALASLAGVHQEDASRGRYCRATGFMLTPDGTLLAAVEARFVASRAYTRRLLESFLEVTEPEALYRVFPGARELTRGSRSLSEPP